MFSDLGLHESLVATLAELGYENPTPVQTLAIPAALTGADLLVSSHTGSGKTAAFLLPSLQRMLDNPKPKMDSARMLILTPTRELAQQVEKAARSYGREVRKLNTACLVGGSSYHLQLKDLGRKPEILICTPGRLLDHIERGRVDLSQIETLVLDEADRMLDMGFAEDIETIVGHTPEDRQTLLFSATLDGVVGHLARKLTRNPQRVEIEKAPEQEAKIEQRLMLADDLDHKNRLLDALLRDETLQQAVVFTATKRAAEELSTTLGDEGFAVEALHGDMHQRARNATLQKLRQGRINILVATDVAARGIDVAGISHVINFDPPRQVEDYVHRIGRTGRAGRSGTAITLVEFRDRRIMRDIERYTGQQIEPHVIPGLEPTRRDERRGEPKRRFGKSNSGGGGGRFKSGYGRDEGGYQGQRRDNRDGFQGQRRDNRDGFQGQRRDGGQREEGQFQRREEGQFQRREPREEGQFQRREPREEGQFPRREEGQFQRREPRDEGRFQRRDEGHAPRQDDNRFNSDNAQPRGARFEQRKPRTQEFSPRRESVQKEFNRRDRGERDGNRVDRQPTGDYAAYRERDPGENFTSRQVADAGQRRDGNKGGFKPRAARDGDFRKREGGGGFRQREGGGYRPRDEGGFRPREEGGYRGAEGDAQPRREKTPRITQAERPKRTVYHNERLAERATPVNADQPPRKKLTISRG